MQYVVTIGTYEGARRWQNFDDQDAARAFMMEMGQKYPGEPILLRERGYCPTVCGCTGWCAFEYSTPIAVFVPPDIASE